MACSKRQLALWISSVVNLCLLVTSSGIHGDVPDDVVYTELHKDVRIGDSAVLTCRFRGSPSAVYWKKGYDPRRSPNLVSRIPTDDVTGKCQLHRVCEIMEMNENYSLIIKDVGISEQGRYICRVANYKGNIIHNFTDVSLYAPPEEPYPVIDGCVNRSSVSSPEPCRVLANNTITITCSVTNYYPRIELFFLHGTKQMTTIHQEEQTNVDSTKNMSISIEAGPGETLYTCVASDVPGSKERKAASIFVESSIIIPSVTRATSSEAMTERGPDNRAVKIVVPLIIVFAIGAAGLVIWWKRKHTHQRNNIAMKDATRDIHERIPMVSTPRLDERNLTSATQDTKSDDQSIQAGIDAGYNSLQTKYNTLELELQEQLKSWLHSAEINLNRCATIEHLDKSFHSLFDTFSKVLTKEAEKTKTCLKEYFGNFYQQEITTQWQQSKLKQLNIAVDQHHIEGSTALLSIKDARRFDILQAQNRSSHENYIMEKAVKLADTLKGNKATDVATDVELQQKFDTMWVSIVHDLTPTTEDKELSMHLVMEEILSQRFFDYLPTLKDELSHNPLHIPPELTLEISITPDDVKEEHIIVKTTKGFADDSKEGQFGELQARYNTVVLTGSIMKEINSYLKDLSNRKVKFQKTYATEVIQKVVHTIDTFNQDAQLSVNCSFVILPKYVIKLAVHVSRHCAQVFSLMQSEYNKKHGIKAKLQDYKNTAWNLFKNTVKQRTEEVIAGDLLCSFLIEIVHDEVKEAVARECKHEILTDFRMTKYHLIVNIMDYLASKGNSEEYKSYIKHAKDFSLRWITQYTNEKMFQRKDGMTRFEEIAYIHIARIIPSIAQSVKNATAEVDGKSDVRMKEWIEKFCQSASEKVEVPVSKLTLMSDRSVVDFNHLQRIILDELNRIQGSLEKAFVSETNDSVVWGGTPPPQVILDKIWGCPEQCPFCREPCTDTTPNHYSLYGRRHSCVQHRPRGLTGACYIDDGVFDGVYTRKKQLLNQTCNYLIQGEDMEFSCDACDFKCRESDRCSTTGNNIVYHKYAEYNTYFPDWDIAPDSTNSMSIYWMWVMANYELYIGLSTDVPPSWRSITKEEAIADLHKIHH